MESPNQFASSMEQSPQIMTTNMLNSVRTNEDFDFKELKLLSEEPNKDKHRFKESKSGVFHKSYDLENDLGSGRTHSTGERESGEMNAGLVLDGRPDGTTIGEHSFIYKTGSEKLGLANSAADYPNTTAAT